MVLIPKKEPTLVEIIDEGSIEQEKRPHLGYSQVGSDCMREMFYILHWAEDQTYDLRIGRIFSTGHIMEKFMIESLEKAGMIVEDQQDYVPGLWGHIKGSIDGIVSNVPGYENERLLLEMKTANDRSWKSISKEGVKRAHKKHYGQIQMYMGRLRLKNALYMVYNKNDSSYYTEIVPFNSNYFKEKEVALADMMLSEHIPMKIGDVTWHECRMCNFKGVCHNGDPVAENCRTCIHADVEDDGVWSCGVHDIKLTFDEQLKGCKRWEVLESLNGES